MTLNAEEVVFAHVEFKSPERAEKYGLDLSVLKESASTLFVWQSGAAACGHRLNRPDGNPVPYFSLLCNLSALQQTPSALDYFRAFSAFYQSDQIASHATLIRNARKSERLVSKLM